MTGRPLAPDLPTKTLFGVEIHAVTMNQVLEWIRRVVTDGERGYIVTPNVDHIVRLQKDQAFREAYWGASVVLPDSTPLMWAARLLRQPLQERGSNLTMDVCALAAREGYGVFLLGASEPVLDQAVRNLRRAFPEIRIVGTHHGYFHDDEPVVVEVNAVSPDILLVALGSPKQELWVRKNWPSLSARVALCVGGAFNYVAGTVSRAPHLMQQLGLEWFWRFLHEPRRLWKRYFVDDMAFGWLVTKAVLRRGEDRR